MPVHGKSTMWTTRNPRIVTEASDSSDTLLTYVVSIGICAYFRQSVTLLLFPLYLDY